MYSVHFRKQDSKTERWLAYAARKFFRFFSFVSFKKTASGFQPSTNMGYGPKVRMMKLSMITLVDTKNSLYQALIQQPAGFFFAAHHLRSAHYAILFLHFLVRCLFSSVLLLLFLCKAKIKYVSRRQSKYVINKYIVHVSNCQKNGNLSCCLPEILSIFCVHGPFLGRKHGSPEN